MLQTWHPPMLSMLKYFVHIWSLPLLKAHQDSMMIYCEVGKERRYGFLKLQLSAIGIGCRHEKMQRLEVNLCLNLTKIKFNHCAGTATALKPQPGLWLSYFIVKYVGRYFVGRMLTDTRITSCSIYDLHLEYLYCFPGSHSWPRLVPCDAAGSKSIKRSKEFYDWMLGFFLNSRP